MALGSGDTGVAATGNSPHRSRRDHARRALLDAARQELETRPWTQITVDVLTSAAGLSRTAFYQHFVDRQELLLTLLAELDDQVGDLGRQWLAGGSDPLAEHRMGLRDIVGYFADNGRLLRACRDSAVADDRVKGAYEGYVANVIGVTVTALRRDAANGHCVVEDPEQLADALTRMNEAYLLAQFGQHPLGNQEVALATLLRVWAWTVYHRPPDT